MEKQHLEMLQLLESIEVMLQNGNSIHPDSVIRGAIRIAIGMDQYCMPEGLDTPEKHEQYLKDIGLKKQTAVEWFAQKLSEQGIDYPLQEFEQAKEMEKAEKIKAQIYICDRIRYWKDNQINSVENLQINLEKQLKELLLTFKSK